ncbi:MAG: excinuclease ABC subunit UvrC [Dethiobacteria bacterium]
MLDQLRAKVRRFPDQPGVYLLKDKNDRVIYVGKARSLRQRVRSYLVDNTSGSPRLKSLQTKLAAIDYVVTDSEVEALILECSLIKEYRPRFNVNLKDDKDYPYLLITPELYPRLELLRLSQKGSKKARYMVHPDREERRFGPFTDVGAVRDTMQFLGSIFPLRRCRQPLDGSPTAARPCLNYQMKRCVAPCRGAEEVSPAEYNEMVRQVELFLQGRHSELEAGLKKKMEEAAAVERFEEAASMRDRLHSLQRVVGQQQKMLLTENSPDRDIISLARTKRLAAVHLFQVRGGKLLSQEHFSLTGTDEIEDSEVISSFIKSYYNRVETVPREVILSTASAEIELLAEWLKMKADHPVRLHIPRRGALKKLTDLALRNGMLRLQEEEECLSRVKNEPLEELGRLLGLNTPPERIEGYDISHLRGDEPVGAMVVFLDGEPYNKGYRRFNIRKAPAGDDYAALQEVLKRRAANQNWPKPDLLFIDGGRGQLNAARKVLLGTVFESLPVIALAKNPDRLFLERSSMPMRMAASDPLLQLLQRIRDEVHRFAISGHRGRKNRSSLHSSLEEIPGVGPSRRTALLDHFGSAEKISQASVEELSLVSGISPALAGEIHIYLRRSRQLPE